MGNIGTSSASGYLTAIELIEAFKKKMMKTWDFTQTWELNVKF
jgi:hypothetical protein